MLKKMKQVALLALVLTFAIGRLGLVTAHAESKPKVMTTFYTVYFLVSQIAGDHADVEMLMSGGQDAHSFEASAKDVAKIQASDLFVYQDDEMEFFVADMLKGLDQEKTQVLESTEGIELLAGDHDHDHEGEDHDHDHEGEDHDHDHEGEDHDHDHEGHDHAGHSHEFDPHTWLDPKVYSQQAENVRDALIQLDPAHEEDYRANADTLIQKLAELDEKYETELAKREDRRFVVQHAAFGYLAHAYGLEQVAITGIQSTQEPSAKQLAAMQDFIKENQIKTIYVDPSMNSSISETVSADLDVALEPLSTLEVVSAEDLAAGQDYFSIMEANLASLMK